MVTDIYYLLCARPSAKFFLHLLAHLILIKPYVGGTAINPILQIRKLRQSLVTQLGNRGARIQIHSGF